MSAGQLHSNGPLLKFYNGSITLISNVKVRKGLRGREQVMERGCRLFFFFFSCTRQ